MADYQNNGRRSLDKLERSFRPLLDVLGATTKAASIDAAAVEAYKAVRRDLAKPATINRELAALRRGFRLAVRLGRLGTRPDFSLLREDNVRRGFFEAEQFRALVKHLPDWLAPVVTFLYWTGARRREATSLEWRNVNRKTKTITLEKTKTDVPRSIPYGALPALVDVVNGQWRRTEAARKAGAIIPWVFHRDGKPIDDFREAWGAACKAAGLPGKIPHDFRRTAARNMLRAGIPQSVAMLIGGWKTDSVFRRYAIVDEKLISENLAKLAKVRQ